MAATPAAAVQSVAAVDDAAATILPQANAHVITVTQTHAAVRALPYLRRESGFAARTHQGMTIVLSLMLYVGVHRGTRYDVGASAAAASQASAGLGLILSAATAAVA